MILLAQMHKWTSGSLRSPGGRRQPSAKSKCCQEVHTRPSAALRGFVHPQQRHLCICAAFVRHLCIHLCKPQIEALLHVEQYASNDRTVDSLMSAFNRPAY